MRGAKSLEQPWERQKGESAQAFEAFTIYLNMGADRSVRGVAQNLSKSCTLISRWSSANHWVERVRAWDNFMQKEARKAAAAEVRAMAQRHIDIAMQLQKTAILALQEQGTDLIDSRNFTNVLKFATDLERSNRETGAEDAAQKSAQDGQLSDLIEGLLEP